MGFNRGLQCALPILLLLCCHAMVGSHAQPVRSRFNAWTPNTEFPTDTQIRLTLDRQNFAGAGSKESFLYAEISAWIKCPPFDSAGTVTTFYLSSSGPEHCELDMEFLGNSTGQPFILHTNVFVGGKGEREQQMYLGFDPSAEFHLYTFRWTKDSVLFLVDGAVVRVFKNLEGQVPGFKYLKDQAMMVYVSIWDGSQWATQGGRVKINYDSAPFVAHYDYFGLNGCTVDPNDAANGVAACQYSPYATGQNNGNSNPQPSTTTTMLYDYCYDTNRNPTPPPECAYNKVE
ncbi:xyloglucan endotransglucosylase protein 7 [Physcomitrium patens]|uniref:Xyloglucan endotransglycosylase/hydrolase n=1 Tax=Physcomitrium patens TaxID=3218 RepID=Q4A3V4_PHYPA|nr:xyloglucan endotransglucosylase/hydrolase protein 9-like [Physcomitrium patens]PNR38125.1 hypothetical protein PHYPA_021236 [Physcomitrium patens]CAH58715.1 xyloglucan endotransglycosylase/hydrolase precursor [Physcomitrium patens]|eukprot:XP_024399559.1 xyloglucan endotransglucosylase/hydrolase protein 9-like [Physcomitrella patens]